MHDSSIPKLLLFTLGFFIACGDDADSDGGTPRGSQRSPDDASGWASGDAGDGKGGDAGPSSSKGDASAGKDGCTTPPPNTVGGKYFLTCGYVCRKGFADCDGLRENGCEVDLSQPSACDRCSPMACLNPAVCGRDAPSCQEHAGARWTLRPSSESDLGRLGKFGEVVAGSKSDQVFATINLALEGTLPNPGLRPPAGALFEVSLAQSDGGALWSANGPADTKASRLWRFGDRLYLFSRANTVLDPTATLYVTDLAGKPLWTKTVRVAGASVCPGAVAVDESGNVYFGATICEGEAEINGKTYSAFAYSSEGVEMLVVSFDAAGNERWRAVPHDSSRGECWLRGRSGILSMLVAGGKLLQLNRECLMEIDTTTGAALTDHKLYLPSDDAKLVADAAGNLYVGGVSTDNYQLFPGNAADTWNEKDWKGLPGRVFVSKYSPSFAHQWTKPVAIHYEAKLVGFDVSPAGRGQLVGRWLESGSDGTFFAFDFDADGRALGAGIFAKPWRPTSVSMDEEGTPYIGGDMKGDPMLGNGMFIWKFPLKTP